MIQAMPSKREQILLLIEEMQCSFDEALDVIEAVWVGEKDAYRQAMQILERHGRISGDGAIEKLDPLEA